MKTRHLRFLAVWTPSTPVIAPLLGLALALAPATFASPASADSSGEEATTPMARARFKEGVDFYDKGQFEQARASFLQAYALKKHPAVLLNLAWSCLKSGHTLDAERYFRQFLSEGKDITDKQRIDANEGLTQSRAKLGRIEIAAPSGTEVTIDGERIGTTPIADQVTVEAGAHTIKFKGADGATETDSVTVLGGERVVARFTKVAAPPPAPPPPLPPPVVTPPPAPPASNGLQVTTPLNDQRAQSRESPPPESHHGGGPFSAPRNGWPILAFSLIAVAGAATAVVLGIYSKDQAQTNADQSAQQIRDGALARHLDPQGICVMPPKDFQSACTILSDNRNQVDTDATIANIGIAVGAAGVLGGIIYWLASDKDEGGPTGSTPIVTPWVGRSVGGLSLTGEF